MKEFITTALITFTLVSAAAAFYIQPRLVGYGCEGRSYPLFAAEEDHFPAPCDAIERIWK